MTVNGTSSPSTVRAAARRRSSCHGGGEDATTLAAQAASLADAGFEAITYDRRGTGQSGRDDWPGDGAGSTPPTPPP